VAEFIYHFPQYTELSMSVTNKYNHLCNYIQEFYQSLAHLDEKTFGIKAQAKKFNYVLFWLRRKDFQNVKECFALQNSENPGVVSLYMQFKDEHMKK